MENIQDRLSEKHKGHRFIQNYSKLMLLNCGVGEDSWESLGLQGDPTSPSKRKSVLGVHWKDWCWSWNSRTLATWCEELTHLKRLWCWERLKVGGAEDDRGWMAGWHHRLDGLEFERTPGVGDGQRGLACCNSWGLKESDMTEWLDWTELNGAGKQWRICFPRLVGEKGKRKKCLFLAWWSLLCFFWGSRTCVLKGLLFPHLLPREDSEQNLEHVGWMLGCHLPTNPCEQPPKGRWP